MPGTTSKYALPYPLPAEPVAEGAQAIRNLAEAVETKMGELAYAEITAAVTISATSEASPNPVVTAPAVTFNGTSAQIIEFFSPRVDVGAAAGSIVILLLMRDGASLGRWGYILNTNQAAAQGWPVSLHRRLVTPSGSHTYAVAAIAGGANGAVQAGAGGPSTFVPAYLRIMGV